MIIPGGFESELESDFEFDSFKYLTNNDTIIEHIYDDTCTKINGDKLEQNGIKIDKLDEIQGCSYFVCLETFNKKFFGNISIAEENIKRMILMEDIDMIISLIDDGELFPNYKFSTGWSMASFSLFVKKYQVFHLCLKYNIDLDDSSICCLSALACANYDFYDEYVESLKIFKLLVSYNNNINLNLQDNYGKTPMMIAIENENFHIAHALIENGASVLVKDTNGNDIFSYAIENKSLKIIQFLLNYFDKYENQLQHLFLPNETTFHHYKSFINWLINEKCDKKQHTVHLSFLENLLDLSYQVTNTITDIVDFCIFYKKYINNIEDKHGDILYDFLFGIHCEKWCPILNEKQLTFKNFLKLTSNELVQRFKVNQEDADFIVKAKNELILNGLDSSMFSKLSKNPTLVDIAISNANICQHFKYINELLDLYIEKLSQYQSSTNYNNFFWSVNTQHIYNNINEGNIMMKKLKKIKKLVDKRNYAWWSPSKMTVAGTLFSIASFTVLLCSYQFSRVL